MCNSNPMLFFHLGLVFLRLDRLVESQYYLRLNIENNPDDAQSWLYLSEIAAKRYDIGTLRDCIDQLKASQMPVSNIKFEEIKLSLICRCDDNALKIALEASDDIVNIKGFYLLIDVVLRTESLLLLNSLHKSEYFVKFITGISERDESQFRKLFTSQLLILLNNIRARKNAVSLR